ncbi:MAG: fibronectin type III-like domain-contianing protein, partial [Proteobacteria bacterium]|nr:fibronectin type III-like domain-contianing protein [Pseudomonadota bacterium]
GFGHGLSYTRFGYSGAAVRAGGTGEPVTLTVRIANAGSRPGEEVAQAYVVPPADGEAPVMTDPILQRQLAGFTRVPLAPGKERTVSLAIDPRDLSSVARDGTRRVLPGKYRFWIGGGQPGDGPGQWVEATLPGSALELPK